MWSAAIAAFLILAALNTSRRDGGWPWWFHGWRLELMSPWDWGFGRLDEPPYVQPPSALPAPLERCGNDSYWHRERRLGFVRAVYDGP